METSDSECFESADDEMYSDDEDIKKMPNKRVEVNVEDNKHVVINPNETDNSKNFSGDALNKNLNKILNDTSSLGPKNNEETEEVNYSKKLDNKVNLEDLGLKNNEETAEVKYSKKLDNKVNLEETIDKINQLTDNLHLTNYIEKQEELLSSTNSNKINELKEDTSILSSQTNKILNKQEVNKSVSSLSAKIKLENTNKESSPKNVNNEENMWDDDWEPIIDKKEESVSTKPTKPAETEDNDNMWDNDAWEPIQDTKVNKKSKDKLIEKDREEDMWGNDDWEPFDQIESPSKDQKLPETSWSGWGNWGVSSILTTATTLTTQVSQGLSTVLENSMGIPDPKELARQDRTEEKMEEPLTDDSKPNLGFGFSNLSNLVTGVSHITKFVENTGSKVISGGLDTLETIGKKTMEVLQEGDPGLKNKRAFLKLDKEKPILSQILREAKERSERANQDLKEQHSKKKVNYESLFDDYHGLVHLEALEMLSKQCDIKLETLSENCQGSELRELLETMDQIKELCELPEEDDEEVPTLDDIKEKIETAVKDVKVSISYEKMLSTWQETETWLNNLKLDFCDEGEIHQEAVQVLAQITAAAVEQFHKCGELLLIKEHRSTADEADSLVQLTTAVTSLIGMVAAKFSEKLNTKSSQNGKKETVNELITNVFFEAGNSSSYVQDAFQLLIPVLQIGAV